MCLSKIGAGSRKRHLTDEEATPPVSVGLKKFPNACGIHRYPDVQIHAQFRGKQILRGRALNCVKCIKLYEAACQTVRAGGVP
jgi:hypothetical protein